MKTIHKIIGACLAITMFTSCDVDKITSVQDDFKINVNPDAVIGKLEVSVINANADSDTNIDATISFSGDQSANIFTTDGKRVFRLSQGFITVGLKRTIQVSEEAPVSVVATITADGFLTKTQEIFFTGEDTQSISIPIMEVDNLPSGTIVQSTTEALTNNETASEITVEVKVDDSTDADSGVEFSIPAGTSFTDEDGNDITGSDVAIDFQTFSTETPTEQEILDTPVEENGEISFDVINELPTDFGIDENIETEQLGKSRSNKVASITEDLIPLNYLGCFYLYVNGRKVYGFSKPTRVRNYLSNYYLSRSTNPKTGVAPKVGDEVDVFYYNWRTRKKESVGKSKIQSSGSRYYVEFNASRSGLYPIGFRKPNVCPDPITQPIYFSNKGLGTWYYYSVRAKNSYYGSGWGCMYISGDKKIYPDQLNYWGYRGFKRLTGDMILTIYNYERSNRKWAIAYNQEISICDLANGQAIDVSNKDCGSPKNIDFRIECSDANYSMNYTGLYYREVNSNRYYNWWNRYGSIINGKLEGSFPCLNDQTEYEFGFYYGKWRITPPVLGNKVNEVYDLLDIDNVCQLIEDNK